MKIVASTTPSTPTPSTPRAVAWDLAEGAAHLLGDWLGSASMAAHRLGGRCYRNRVRAQLRAQPGEYVGQPSSSHQPTTTGTR